MPRFGVAFNRRKSTATAEEVQNAIAAAPEHSSFRVIERSAVSTGKSFDGGARLARASGTPLPKHHLDLGEDNMFADLKANRGSGASNTTKATSTDASSRHSNASTAPSSADLAHDDWRHASKKSIHDVPPRSSPKSSGSGFLNRAGRTFSFGQKKNSLSLSKDDDIPDVPPVPAFRHTDDFSGRSRGLTDSTSSTATPPKLENGNIDLGGDFGSMFTGPYDRRGSVNALKNEGSAAPRSLTGNRPMQPPPLSIDKTARVDPPPESWNSHDDEGEHEGLLGSSTPSPIEEEQMPPPVPRHQVSYKALNRPSDIIEDEDAKLLQDSLAAGRLLAETEPESSEQPPGQWGGNRESYHSLSRNQVHSSFKKGDDNLFEGTVGHATRIETPFVPPVTDAKGNKVMTPAEFERYRKDKEWQKAMDHNRNSSVNEDEEDEINYDDDDDDLEKSKQQAKQRRKQEAHMAVYRQQMMKVTGEKADASPERPTIGGQSVSAPQLGHLMAPSPQFPPGVSDEDDDEEVPLAILQAHGFPNRNRPPTRLSVMGSNPNLRATAQIQQPPRPGSVTGDGSSQRHSMLPAFARNLPQDPFIGAGIAKPVVRESLAFGGGIPASQPQPPMAPGGLVGVIASEERSRALRRGSPNVDKMAMNNPGFDPIGGIPPHMMYGMPQPMPQQMPQLQPPSLTVGDQAQLQMNQQMTQFMQMQMQFMQMMAGQNGGQPPQPQQMSQPPPQIQMQMPYGGFAGTQSMNDVSSRHSMANEPMVNLEAPRRMDAGLRTMSMVQPSSSSFLQQPGYAGSIHGGLGGGYTPSIAPSERSNVGLPGRYRPVTQASSLTPPTIDHRRTNTMSGALGRWDENKTKSSINIITKSSEGSDDDDEEGWEAMKAKRDRKKSSWKNKKSFGSELSAMI